MSTEQLDKFRELETEESILISAINRNCTYLDPVQNARSMTIKRATEEKYRKVSEELNELRSRL